MLVRTLFDIFPVCYSCCLWCTPINTSSTHIEIKYRNHQITSDYGINATQLHQCCPLFSSPLITETKSRNQTKPNLLCLICMDASSYQSTPKSITFLPIPNITNFIFIKLDESNYLLWSRQSQSILISIDLFGYVERPLQPLSDSMTTRLQTLHCISGWKNDNFVRVASMLP